MKVLFRDDLQAKYWETKLDILPSKRDLVELDETVYSVSYLKWEPMRSDNFVGNDPRVTVYMEDPRRSV